MIGKVISHYRIVEKLGEGGMGVVYKAEDTKLKRFVALKFLPRELTRDVDAKTRFVREARAASALDHPNICTIYEVDETPEGHMFICMAYYEGEALDKRISRGPLDIVDAIDIAVDAGRGLAKAHKEGITHRDIKPANIVITGENQLKIVDFGLAMLSGQTGTTKTGVTVGTSPYMSPEQAQGGAVDHRTDVWSLGVVLYQMLAGTAPFRGKHDAAVLYSVVHEDPKPASVLRDEVPPELGRIVEKALAKNPDDRYQSVDDMIVDLEAARVALVGTKAAFAQTPKVLPRPGRRTLLVGVPLVLAAILLGWWLTREAPQRGPAPSIAVLPLVNLAADKENEFFVDGMTEELITQLAQIQSLKVISRSSVMRFKGSDAPITDIARQLDVSTVLEGSVLWAGDQVRISIQLIDGVNEGHLWANSYVSDLGDVLALQRRVARDVAAQARVELTTQDEERLSESPVVDAEAYELYLMGRFHWNKRTEADLERAMEYYKRAIELDPDYGLAYAGLAETQIVKGSWSVGLRPREMYPVAKEMALKALEIDPRLAAAHSSLGAIADEYEWDWEEAESQLLRAIELNPNYATAHQWYGELLATLGRMEESVRELRLAQELDPFSLIINSIAGMYLVVSGDSEAGMAELDKVQEMDPFFPAIYKVRQNCYDWLGDHEKSAQAWVRYQELAAISERQEEDAEALRAAYEAGGLPEFRNAAISQMERQYAESYFDPALIAGFLAAAGEIDSAMAWLERGYQERATAMYWIPTDGRFEVMQDDPRFIDLMKRMGLTYWRGKTQPAVDG
jgi:TolB-like protein/tRNA A-37 threonylcarbamoyl transferase component Bud32